MPGFTHLQVAQPVTFGHHLLAWNEMLERDYARLIDCRKRLNVSPLGAAALAGTTFPIDRHATAKALGFDAPTRNSLDSVADRDFAIEFCAVAALAMNHLSRISEELILWTSAQFGFINLPDRFCTGSSIMPQKKNPDVPELVRGKSGRATGNLVALLTLMKSQPLAYNKDNQEDKEALFDSVVTLNDCLRAFADMIPAIQANEETMRQAALSGFSTATDLADYLVRAGVPFRDAHEVVGQAVAHCVALQCDLADLTLKDLQGFHGSIQEDVYDVLTLDGSVAARNHCGGTAPSQVKAAAQTARASLEARPFVTQEPAFMGQIIARIRAVAPLAVAARSVAPIQLNPGVLQQLFHQKGMKRCAALGIQPTLTVLMPEVMEAAAGGGQPELLSGWLAT